MLWCINNVIQLSRVYTEVCFILSVDLIKSEPSTMSLYRFSSWMSYSFILIGDLLQVQVWLDFITDPIDCLTGLSLINEYLSLVSL